MRVKLEALKTAVTAIKHDALRARFEGKYKRLTNKVEDIETGEVDDSTVTLDEAVAVAHRRLDSTIKLAEVANEWMETETSGSTDITLKAGGVVVTYQVTPQSINMIGFVQGDYRLAFYPHIQFATWAKDHTELLTVLAMRYKITEVVMGDTRFDANKGRVGVMQDVVVSKSVLDLIEENRDPAVGWWGQPVVPEGSVVSVQ